MAFKYREIILIKLDKTNKQTNKQTVRTKCEVFYEAPELIISLWENKNLFPKKMLLLYRSLTLILIVWGMPVLVPFIVDIIQTVISILYVVTGEAIALLEYLGFLATLMLVVSVYCVLYLKWKKPNINRPIKVRWNWRLLYVVLALKSKYLCFTWDGTFCPVCFILYK